MVGTPGPQSNRRRRRRRPGTLPRAKKPLAAWRSIDFDAGAPAEPASTRAARFDRDTKGRILRAVRLPAQRVGGVTVPPENMRAVLEAIHAADPDADAACVSAAAIAAATGLGVRTVKRALAGLKLIEAQDPGARIFRGDGQVSSERRIEWWWLLHFVPPESSSSVIDVDDRCATGGADRCATAAGPVCHGGATAVPRGTGAPVPRPVPRRERPSIHPEDPDRTGPEEWGSWPELAGLADQPVEPLPAMQHSSIYAWVNSGRLRDPKSMKEWYRRQLSAPAPGLDGANKAELALVLAAAYHALTCKKVIKTREALFAWIVSGSRWHRVQSDIPRAIDWAKKGEPLVSFR